MCTPSYDWFRKKKQKKTLLSDQRLEQYFLPNDYAQQNVPSLILFRIFFVAFYQKLLSESYTI